MSRLIKKLKIPAEIKDCLQWPIALASSEGDESMSLPSSDKKQAPEMWLVARLFYPEGINQARLSVLTQKIVLSIVSFPARL